MAIQGLNGFQLGDRTLMVQRASQGRSSQTSYGGAGGGSGGGMGGGGAGMGANAAPLGTPVNLRDLGECFSFIAGIGCAASCFGLERVWKLTVKRGVFYIIAPNILAAANGATSAPTSRVMLLLNMVAPDELVNDDDFNDIL